MSGRAVLLAAYACATLVGATLVFLVQPMAAKLLLPQFGGSPAVWTTSLLFFQAALLIGYGWAHLSTTRLGLRRQPVAQLILLALPLLVLPIALPAWTTPPTGSEPALWLLLVLAVAVGPPYVAVTTASPVLQRWFSATDHPHAPDPYFLYAMGNVGSLFGLLAYPFLIEPNLAVADQAILWSAGYVLFLGLSGVAALLLRRHRRIESATAASATAASSTAEAVPTPTTNVLAEDRTVAPTLRRRLTWIALAFVPSSLMLGATTYISADIAAVPLLWVVPLSLYLITFILAFSPRNPLTPSRMAALLPFAVVLLALPLVGAVALPLSAIIAINLGVFFVAALLAHGRLAADRPAARYLTEFYVLLAVGGALGGLFNALIAPQIFDSILEYPLAIVLALLVRPGRPSPDAKVEHRERLIDLLVPAGVFIGTLAGLVVLSRVADADARVLSITLAVTAVAMLVMVRRPVRFAGSIGALLVIPLIVGQSTVVADRSFFGVNRVVDDGDLRLLVHGTTTHGGQRLDDERAREPLTYYHETGPFGVAVEAYRAAKPGPMRIGVIGLGAGGIAAYVRPGDSIVFFEIDPTVVRFAEDASLFTFLSGSPGDVRVVLGDGRLTLAEEPDAGFDIMVLDAFSGDAPPAHLLTTEALTLYAQKTAPEGLLLFNASNRFVDIPGVLAAGLRALEMPLATPSDAAPGEPPTPEKEPAAWIASANDAAMLTEVLGPVSGGVPSSDGIRPWTDDFSDVVSVIRW